MSWQGLILLRLSPWWVFWCRPCWHCLDWTWRNLCFWCAMLFSFLAQGSSLLILSLISTIYVPRRKLWNHFSRRFKSWWFLAFCCIFHPNSSSFWWHVVWSDAWSCSPDGRRGMKYAKALTVKHWINLMDQCSSYESGQFDALKENHAKKWSHSEMVILIP